MLTGVLREMETIAVTPEKKQLRDSINEASLSMHVASEENRAAFKDEGDMAANLGVREGMNTFDGPSMTAMNWLNLEIITYETVKRDSKNSSSSVLRATSRNAQNTTSSMLARRF